MVDRNVYTIRLLSQLLVVDRIFNFNVITYFTDEWLWNYLLVYMNRNIGFSPDAIFFIVTTFVLWRFAFTVADRAGLYYVLLLLNPLVVGFAFSQLRLAFAIAVLSIFWTGRRGKFITILAYIVCTSIHTATILFAIMYAGANYIISPTKRNIIFLCSIGIIISLLIGPFRESILSIVNDRRVEYSDASSSLSFLSFWIIMLLFIFIRWRCMIYSIDVRYSIIVLSLISTNIFTGGYSSRFIAAIFPSLLITISKWPSRPLNPIALLFLPYALLQWLNWLKVI